MRISDWSSDVCSSDLLTPVVKGIGALRGAQHEMADLAGLIADPASDPEMRALAESEFHGLKERLPDLEHELKILLLPKDRSEEHTSELQSLMRISYAVFCLKKKKQHTDHNTNKTITSQA